MTKTMSDARWKILGRANKGREKLPPYGMRNLQQAVHRCRNRRLISEDVLIAAGFNAHGPNLRGPKQQ